MRKTLLTTSIALVFFIHYSRAQSVGPSTINAAGRSATIGTDVYEWSVGEMTLVNTASSSNIIVTQGVLQPLDEPVGINDVNRLSRLVKAYPNPSSQIVYLETAFDRPGKLTCELRDITGRSIIFFAKDVNAGKEISEINLSSLANAAYMLYVSYKNENESIQQISFKIEKIN